MSEDKTEKEVTKIEQQKVSPPKWLLYLGLPLVGALLTVVFQQSFFNINEKSKKEIELKKELIKEKMPIYNKLRSFADLGISQTAIKFQYVFTFANTTGVNGQPLSANKTVVITLPSISVDSSVMKQWDSMRITLESQRDFIDYRVFEAFTDVVKFKTKHPFPSKVDLENIEQSEWNKDETKSQWLTENYFLKERLESVLEMN